jgi:hypothetical protein
LEIEKANVIILVYDVNNIECKKRIRTHWIPRILKINDKVYSHSKHDLYLDLYNISRQQSRLEILS